MSASKIQCHYADLNNAAQQFTRQSEGTQQLLRTVQTCLQQLQGGAWRGKGANTFYAELEREVLPGVERLISALRNASSATQRIGQLLEQTEREVGALFMGGAGDAEGYGGGDGDGIPEQTNEEPVLDEAARKKALENELREYGITLSGTWSLSELEMLRATVDAAANRLQSFAADEYTRNGLLFPYTPQQVFRRIFGDLTFVRGEGTDSNGDEEGGRWGQYDHQRITLWGKAFTNRLRTFSERSIEESMAFLTMHELGHDLNREMVLVKRGDDLFERLTTRNYYQETSQRLFGTGSDAGTAGYTYIARTQHSDMWLEYQADAVANWLDGTFDDTDDGRTRQAQMDGIMRALIFNKFGHPEQLVNMRGVGRAVVE